MHCVCYSSKQHNNQQMHTKLLKTPHNMYNSYMLNRQVSTFGESKIPSRASTSTTFPVLTQWMLQVLQSKIA